MAARVAFPMKHKSARTRVGPYELTRPLRPGGLSQRGLALHTVEQTSHVLHRFAGCHDKAEQRRFIGAFQTVSCLDHPHILPLEGFFFDRTGVPCAVTPFTGDADGLLTLEGLLRVKGGQMEPEETERAIRQLLEACAFAHDVSIHNGPIGPDDVLIDRRGSVLIEFYGLSRQLRGLAVGNEELVRDEVRSVVEIAYLLLTGIRAEAPVIPAGRLVKRLDPLWDEWLAYGLDPTEGFEDASHALESLPATRRERERKPIVNVRSVLGRLGLGANPSS